MKILKENFIEMVLSEEKMLFAYHKKEDMLYFSDKAAVHFGCDKIIRHYWKDSRIWNWIPQHNQEELVNILRHEVRGEEAVTYLVPVTQEKEEASVCYKLKIEVIWDDDQEENLIIGVKGEILTT